VDAVLARDFPTVQGLICSSLSSMCCSTADRPFYVFLDPRIRY